MAAMILYYRCSFYLGLCGECVSVIIIITTRGVETENKRRKVSQVLRKSRIYV